MRNPPTPRSPTEEVALERLQQDDGPVLDSFTREIAIKQFGDLDIETATAHSVLDRRRSNGYRYAVESDLRITE